MGQSSSEPVGASAGLPEAERNFEYSAQQLRSLVMTHRIRPDLALLPHQMPRLRDDILPALPPAKPRRTISLRNAVALNRKTLAVVPTSASPSASAAGVESKAAAGTGASALPQGRLRVSFRFDALCRARITIVFCAMETVDAGTGRPRSAIYRY